MLGVKWNALRVGDRVLVHDSEDLRLPLIPGIVTAVTRIRQRRTISIRLAGPAHSAGSVVEPEPLVVHSDPPSYDERCWRCELAYAASS